VRRLVLKAGREKSLQRRHPWIYTGAVERMEGDPQSGDTVEVRSSQGGFLAWAAFSPQSQICARVWDWREGARIDADFFATRLRRAFARREPLISSGTASALRLVHGESDGLPGIVVDRFADWLVLQLSSAGAWRWRDDIAALAADITGIVNVFERSDADVLTLEGMTPRVGEVTSGTAPAHVGIEENGLKFEVDLRHGHKTGFYLDQRDNRALVRGHAQGREVLDCFCYSGGFTVSALAGGATRVTAIDSSKDAIEAARRHLRANELAEERAELLEGDVFALLRKFRDQARKFDVVVLDPPKFAPTAAHAERAARAYKDINLWALKLLRPGGTLFTFSCSGGVSRDLFQKIVAGAAIDAGVETRVVHHLSAGVDHPVSLAFPEGEYLKGLLCRVD
jgi:23S rRNA (cytosine1962-C5)-methyltransferase